MADGHMIKCMITGKIKIEMMDDNGEMVTATLLGCMYVPGLSRCLFGITRFANQGHHAMQRSAEMLSRCTLERRNAQLRYRQSMGSVYHLALEPLFQHLQLLLTAPLYQNIATRVATRKELIWSCCKTKWAIAQLDVCLRPTKMIFGKTYRSEWHLRKID